jgi:IS30 family transposase
MAKNLKNKKKHLSDEERFCIEKMLGVGESFADIGRTLDRGKSTITEEVERNGGRKRYRAVAAVRRAYWKQYRKKRNCNKVACDGPLTRFVEQKLIKEKLSPGAISSRLGQQTKLQYASEKSIRKFIVRRPGLEKNLFWNRNNHKGGGKRENKIFLTDPERKFIETRPISALYSYGHWEMDFIVSKHNSTVLLVCIEKYSKKIKLALLPNRNNELVNQTLRGLLMGETVWTITTDNDIGFAKWKELELMLGTQIYFCHPYHSWEKGLVENCNRWLREFIPKKTDLSRLSERNIKWIEAWFNHKPRECLDGRTAHEVSVKKECGMIVESLSVNFPEVRIRG